MAAMRGFARGVTQCHPLIYAEYLARERAWPILVRTFIARPAHRDKIDDACKIANDGDQSEHDNH